MGGGSGGVEKKWVFNSFREYIQCTLYVLGKMKNTLANQNGFMIRTQFLQAARDTRSRVSQGVYILVKDPGR